MDKTTFDELLFQDDPRIVRRDIDSVFIIDSQMDACDARYDDMINGQVLYEKKCPNAPMKKKYNTPNLGGVNVKRSLKMDE